MCVRSEAVRLTKSGTRYNSLLRSGSSLNLLGGAPWRLHAWRLYEIKWCVATTSVCRLALVLLVKVEVLKPLSSSRRLDKGELPGVRSLSSYRLAGGQTASRQVASVRGDMWCGRDKIVSSLYYHLPVESPGPHGKCDRHPNGLMVRAHRGLNSREWRPPGGISLGATWWEWS